MNGPSTSIKSVLYCCSQQSWLMGAILSLICVPHSTLHSVETQHLDISLEQIELPHFTQPKRGMKEGKFRASAMHNGGAWFPPKDAKRSALGEQPLQMVRLENNLLTVEVLPRQGAALNRAYQRDGTDWFYHEQRLKDWIPWWESGVKASFPLWNTASASSSQAPGIRKKIRSKAPALTPGWNFHGTTALWKVPSLGAIRTCCSSKKSVSSPMIHGCISPTR